MPDGWILLEKPHNHVRDLAYGDVRRKTRNASAFPKPKSQEVRDNESVLEAVQVTKAPGSFVILCFASRQQSIPGQCLGRSRESHGQPKQENNRLHMPFSQALSWCTLLTILPKAPSVKSSDLAKPWVVSL
jgi:hypothetical protein